MLVLRSWRGAPYCIKVVHSYHQSSHSSSASAFGAASLDRAAAVCCRMPASTTTTNSAAENNKLSEWMVDLVAGWASGAAAVLACQPVDTVLTRWQAATPSSATMVAPTMGATNSSCNYLNSSSTSSWRGLTVNLYQTAGWTALWRGASPMITAVPFQNALLMSGYGFGTRFYSGQEDISSATSSGQQQQLSRSKQLGAIFVGGCTGGVLQSFLMSPVELIKVAQQCGGGVVVVGTAAGTAAAAAGNGGVTTAATTMSLTAACRNVIATSTATRGLTATLLRDGVPHGVWFVAYDVCKATMLTFNSNNSNNNNEQTLLQSAEDAAAVPVHVSLVSGAVAAAVAWGVGYPADLIKTRIQASAAAGAGGTSTIIETARQIVREADGRVVAGLYRGFGLKLLRSVPASMIGFTVYEGVKEQMNRYEQRSHYYL